MTISVYGGRSGAIGAADAVRMSHRANNFDLVRLVAAAQVAVLHVVEHFEVDAGRLPEVLGIFPGVPIFFVVSGFLVAGSLDRSESLSSFYRNRVLRVFPGLWVCLAVSIGLAALFVDLPWTTAGFAAWVLAQSTVAQFYNPEFLRGFGVGVLNGSLWTIPVEVQFYLALPLIYWMVRRLGSGALLAFLCIALAAHGWFLAELYGTKSLVAKLTQVTLLPWLGLFMIGVGARRYWRMLSPLFCGRFLPWLAVYIATALLLGYLGLDVSGNRINTLSAVLLGGLVLSAAYTRPELSDRLLGGNDVSYGLYLYHGPIMNAVLAAGTGLSPAASAGLVLIASVIAAVLSWRLVERPALGLKPGAAASTLAPLVAQRS